MMDKVLLIPKETTEKFIQLQFKDAKPPVKCQTDVTKGNQKLYCSPVLAGFNSEIITYTLYCSPNLEQMKTMLEETFTAEQDKHPIHSP